MPRARPSNTPPCFTKEQFALDEDYAQEALERLSMEPPAAGGDDRSDQAIRRIEHCVGMYLGQARVADDLPTTAALRAELAPFLKAGDFSADTFERLYPWLQRGLRQKGVDPANKHVSDEAVRAAGTELLKELSGESRGRRLDRPLNILITKLRGIYRTYAEGGDTERARYGAVNPLSPAEYDELEFVELVLEAAGIQKPSNLRKRFLDVGRPPHERAEVLNRLARRRRKSDQQ